MGGPHVSCLPEEALQHCDSVVIGEAESVWRQVVGDFENNALKRIYRGQPLEDFFTPVYEYFLNLSPGLLYNCGFPMTRGCRYHCDFCARPSSSLRFVKIEQVISLLRRMRGAVKNPFIRRPLIIFRQENNIFSDPGYAKKLFRALIPLKIRWICTSSIDIAFDDEALRLAKESGCQALYIGFESIRPGQFIKTSVSGMKTPDDYAKAVAKIRSYGIHITGSFIVGLDDYTHRDYLRLLLFLLRVRFYFVALTLLTPLPGTALFARLKQEGRIRTFDWDKYDLQAHVVFRPKQMTGFALMFWFIIIRVFSYFTSTFGFRATISILVGYELGFSGMEHVMRYLYSFVDLFR